MPSALHFFSLGQVLENKKPYDPRNHIESMMINVLALETHGGLDGEAAFNPVETTVETTNFAGDKTAIKGMSSQGHPCKWLPYGGNRLTPPDVQLGEQVEIWRLGDTDEYYWRDTAQGLAGRRLETMILVWGATKNPNGHGFDLSKCYFLEVSSHRGLITLATSKDLGEPFAYTIQLNTREGNFILEDDIETQVVFESPERRISMSNADGSLVEIHRKKTRIVGPEEVSLESGGTAFVLTPAGTVWRSKDVAVSKG